MRNGTGPEGNTAFALHCRGEVRLYYNGCDRTPVSRKGRALLAILAAEQRPLSRMRIIDLLWSDRQEEQARASLRTLLADLREQFGAHFDDLLVVDREHVTLSAGVLTDLTDPSLSRPAGELFEGLDHIDPELDDWLRVERQRWEKQPSRQNVPECQAKSRQGLPLWALVVALLLAGGALLYFRPWARPEQPVVAVLKFKDLTGRNGLLADGIAEELRVHLANHPTIHVIGRQSSEGTSLLGENAVEAAREKLRATHVVEGAVLDRNGIPSVSARLISTLDSEAVWTDIIYPQGTSLLKSASQIAARIANNINDSVGQGSGAAFEADAAAYADLFKARQLNSKWEAQAALEAKSTLAGVLRRYPNFAPALAVMAEAAMRASDHPSFEGPVPLSAARTQAVDYARRAIKAAPQYGLAYSAMGVALFGTSRELDFHRRAVQLSPGSFEIHRRLARAMESAGDVEGSLRHSRQAYALEPLNMRMAVAVERALALSGRRDEIQPLVADFSRRTDHRADVLRLAQIAAFDTGDLSSGYIAGLEASRLDPQDWIAANNLISMDMYLRRRKEALDVATRVGFPDSGWTRLLIAADIDALQQRMERSGQEFWSVGWAAEDAAELLVANGRSTALIALYDRTRKETQGREPDLNSIPGSLITALQQAGRAREADQLLRQLTKSWTDRSQGFGTGRRALYLAYLAGYARNRRHTFEQLDLAMAEHWTNLNLAYVPIEQVSAFSWLRGDPRFEELLRGHHVNIERERRELEAELKRLGRGWNGRGR